MISVSDELLRISRGGITGGGQGGPDEQTSGLEYDGNLSTLKVRFLYWDSPFPIYPATFFFKVFPREKTSGSNPRYYTTFFWGNNGDFAWDVGTTANTYYGAHPYPIPAPNGPGQWEISASTDVTTGVEVEWDRWFSQVFRGWRVSSTNCQHEFIWDHPAWLIDSGEGIVNNPVTGFSSWAATDPPSPCICVGQAPGLTPGSTDSWGAYPGREEFNGIIRGIIMFPAQLSDSQINQLSPLETNAAVLTKCIELGISAPWYLNMNPTPTDVTDKSGNGHHPAWEGADRPTLWIP